MLHLNAFFSRLLQLKERKPLKAKIIAFNHNILYSSTGFLFFNDVPQHTYFRCFRCLENNLN